jgi:hypothetical protein
MGRARWWAVALLAVLVGVIGAVYLLSALTAADGRAVAPLDDAYITFQYARQIARGYAYRFNDASPPTTGMTSPLFGFFLAGFYRLGFTGERLVGLAVGLGVVWLALVAWLTYRLVTHLLDEEGASRGWAIAAAVLVTLAGAVQWACFNGMETGLFTVLTLAALDTFLSKRQAWCALWLGLAGLTRPGGLILAGLVWAVTVAEGLVSPRDGRWRRWGALSLAVVAGLVPFVVNWALTGTASATGLQAKSWLQNVPWYPEEIARSVLLFYRRIVVGLFAGWQAPLPWFAPPGLLLFSALGWVALGRRRRWQALVVSVLWFAVGALSSATLITATWHLGRYQVPYLPLMLALGVTGLAHLHGRAAPRWQRALVALAALWLLASAAYSTPRFASIYRRAVSTVVRQQLEVARWLETNLPAEAWVGVHDTGSLRYLGGRPTYDLIGLTTAHAAEPWRHGAGSVFEAMEHSPERPDYFAIYPDVFSIPYLAATDLFAEELFRVDVPDAVVASAGPVQGVWRADWRLAGSGERFYQPDVVASTQGMLLVDALDVADLEDEDAHNLKWWQDARRPGFPTEVWQMDYRALPEREVLDGGRLLTGALAFDVATRPGEPLWLVARLHAHEAGAVRVEVDGRDLGRWAYPPVPGQWLETVFRVPAEAVTGRRTHVRLQVGADNPDFQHYAPYYFWFMQGEPDVAPAVPEHRVDVTFDGDLSLLGFDLPQQRWQAGDVVPVTLYWQTAAQTDRDARVFVHLYDAQGNLGPQVDGWAFHGTRPPYTWFPGEVVVDPRLLTLPADLAPGRFSLEVGLYHPDGSGRLPALQDGVPQPEQRVALTTIEVTE